MTTETIIKRQNEKVLLEFEKLPKELIYELNEEVVLAGEDIRTAIITRIQRGTKSGRVYTFRGAKPGEKPTGYHKSPLGHFYPVVKRSVPHRASAPGESPASDNGDLVARIISLSQGGGVQVGPISGENKVPIFLEEGTRTMKARPYFAPAVKEVSPIIENNMAKAIERILS